MLDKYQQNEIKKLLENGKEVYIACANVTRKELLHDMFEKLPGKLQIKAVG